LSPERLLSARSKAMTMNRWDSWAERTPKESPKKPKRRDIVATLEFPREIIISTTSTGVQEPRRRHLVKENSRWFSHSESSRTLTSSPRRTLSPTPNQSSTEQDEQGAEKLREKPLTDVSFKGSNLTCSTCDSRSSSAMSHNFSIPWCSSHDS
jgi:hypothetical protein